MAVFGRDRLRRVRVIVLALALSGMALSCATDATDKAPGDSASKEAPPSATASANAEPDAGNELPFGLIDWPTEGTVVPVSSRLLIAGWALDDSAVKEVRVFFDDHFKVRTDISLDRPDLTKAYPKYMHGSSVHGWKVDIIMPSEPHSHSIMAQAVDDRGATRDLGTVKISLK